ncbi:MAG: hypothetical protein QM811_30240 [Pirellulales bacterium]
MRYWGYALSASGAVVYSEAFPNTAVANISYGAVGWNAYSGTTATDVTSGSTNLLVSNLAGPDAAIGYAAKNNLVTGNGLIYTSEFGAAASRNELVEFSLEQRTDDRCTALRDSPG